MAATAPARAPVRFERLVLSRFVDGDSVRNALRSQMGMDDFNQYEHKGFFVTVSARGGEGAAFSLLRGQLHVRRVGYPDMACADEAAKQMIELLDGHWED